MVSHVNWSHGIIGIVAAKLLEKYKKPTYVLEEMGEESKGVRVATGILALPMQ